MKNKYREILWLFRVIQPFGMPLIKLSLMGSLLSLVGVGIAIISKGMIDSAVDGYLEQAVWAGIIFVLLILLQVCIRAFLTILTARTKTIIQNTLQIKIYKCLMNASWKNYSKYHSGDLMTRMTSDIKIISDNIVTIIPDIISLGVGLTAAFIVLFYFDDNLAILAFVMILAALVLNRLFGQRIKFAHSQIQDREGVYRGITHETLMHMLLLKSFCREENVLSQISQAQETRKEWILKKNILSALGRSLLVLGYWSGYFLAFYWGVSGLYAGTISFGTMAAFLQLVGQVQGPVIGLAYTYPQMIATLASAERILEIEEIPPDVSISQANEGKSGSFVRAGLEMVDVSFSYREDQPLLSHINLQIPPGEVVALTGASGSGKSTLIQLILALLTPDKGEVLLVDEYGKRWKANAKTRSVIAYVPQGNSLISGTILDNILMGNPKASVDEISEAVKQSDAWEFIKKLPEGFMTKVGEKGVGLSEGQAQRIAITRALVKHAPFLILDEATSWLGMESNRKVIETLRNLDPPRTCIIVTHQERTIKACDRIFLLQNGKLYT